MSQTDKNPAPVYPIDKAIRAMDSTTINEMSVKQHISPLFCNALNHEKQPIYLANHSLGRMLNQTTRDVLEGLNYWSMHREDAWPYWLEEMQSFRKQISLLINAPGSDCIIPKTSAGQGLRTILNCYNKPIRVITSTDEFNSIDHIIKVYAQRKLIHLKQIKPRIHYHYQIDDFLGALEQGADLMVISMVLFTTGQWLSDLKTLIEAAHRQNTLILLDVYHAAGAIPVDVTELDSDFAIGGSYKYLRGGPGASWLYLNPRHLDGELKTLDTGWFAQPQSFAFERPRQPQFAPGGDAFLESTPAILPFYQARAGLKFTLGLGVQRLNEYTIHQQRILERLLMQHAIPFLGSIGERGAFIAIPHPQAEKITLRLKHAGIICDARENLIRICPDILNTEEELTIAIDKLSELWKLTC